MRPLIEKSALWISAQALATLILITSTEALPSPSEQDDLYAFEGTRIKPQPCDRVENFDDQFSAFDEPDISDKGRLIAKYVARLQGSKAVVSEYCLDEDQLTLPLELPRGSCMNGQECPTYYDTYRRGPVYFARFLAAASAALPNASVKLHNRLKLLEEVVAEGAKKQQEHLKTERVSRQSFQFKLNRETRCITQLKLFRDEVAHQQISYLQTSGIDLSHRLSSGFIWAEHRATKDGYQLLITEHRFVETHHEGELLERSLLCTHPHRPVRAEGMFKFMAREIDRETLRVYAVPTQSDRSK
jgi:hypothetical protein